MSLLIVSLVVDDLSPLDERTAVAFDEGADMVELRVDGLECKPEALNAFLRDRTDRRWIITLRSRKEGGKSDLSAIERADWLARAVAETGAYIDFEYADWCDSADVRKRLSAALPEKEADDRRLILSAHRFTGPFDDADALVRAMLAERRAAAAKIAFTANDIRDSFAAHDLMHQFGSRVIVVAMGEDGLWSRVLAKKLGAFGSFASLDAQESTAPGQLTIKDMIALYRWSRIDRDTRVFGVIGDPVGHSMSPFLFNRWFAEHGVNGVYMPLRARGGANELHDFLTQCANRSWLDLHGCSVTIPHKTSALDWAGGGADSMARWIGAANTLVFRRGAGALVPNAPRDPKQGERQTVNRGSSPAAEGLTAIRHAAFNTDCYAALDSLCEALVCARADLSTFRFDILGAGGAARALAYGLREYGGTGTIFARNLDAAKQLGAEYGFNAAHWDYRADNRSEIIINTTSIGMLGSNSDVAAHGASAPGESPMPPKSLGGRRLVFDLIYNPPQTRLLRDAAALGVATLNGLDMFVRQAAVQLELWTGIAPDLTSAREWLADVLRSTP